MPKPCDTTHTLLERELILYRRERSTIWQCRFKVDGVWQRASTKHRDFDKAREAAKRLMIEAEIRKQSNLPVITRKFRDIAKQAMQRMDNENAAGKGKVSYTDYKRVINDYLIPALGKRSITSIDYTAIEELEAMRAVQMGRAPRKSTLLMHNAALNRVFDEAIIRNFLTESNRPRLESKGKAGDRRPAFDVEEVRMLLDGLEAWTARGRTERSRAMRALMHDYIDMLLDTGARPGKELMNLKWRQIKSTIKPVVERTGEINEEGEPIDSANLNRGVEMTVSGKTGTREILGNQPTVAALVRIMQRNYGTKGSIVEPFAKLTKKQKDDYVLRVHEQNELGETVKADIQLSLQKMFESYLQDMDLLIDPRTEQKRVFYSLRHTYATFRLTYDKVPIHTLSKQMGTSTLMIERHYSHLSVKEAVIPPQKRGKQK